MPFGSVSLIPGVNVERTPTLLRAGISQSSLIRFRDSLVQKYGGWEKFYQYVVNGIPRDLHAWQDLNSVTHLSVGTTSQLGIITNGVLADITPQTLISDFAPNISTTANSSIVSIDDPNIANVTIYDSVFFNVPVSIGGLILDGLYQIFSITGTSSYTIDVGTNATTTESNPTATNDTTVSGDPTLHFASTPSWIAAGMSIYNLTTPASIPAGTLVQSTGGATVTMNENAAGAGVGNGDNIVFCSIPIFTTTSGSSTVSVKFINHGTLAGDIAVFPIATTGNGITIQGAYPVLSVTDANNFIIQTSNQATAGSSFSMNGGNVELVYYIALGPAVAGVGYGLGQYGEGLYGFGTGSTVVQTGTKITATDWTSDNWGAIWTGCPEGAGLYYFDPTGGFVNASVISSGPPFNTGMFVSMSQQIMVAFGSSVHEAIGYQLQPLLVQWCDVGNFFEWRANAATQAGNFVIPTGSAIKAGMAVSNQNLIWTDLDLWAMSYIGPPDVFGFNKIGAGMGAASTHAVQQLRGSVFWMGQTNFYGYTSGGANVLPCPVWDAVFQNINTAFLQNVRAMPNTPFNEVGWLYPSAASTSGECDSYVKMNITDPGAPWDYGPLARSAWIDQTVLGMPIGASPQSFIYQHETTPDADGVPLISSFTTGEFYLAEGEEYAYVDQILPDFRWGTFSGSPTAQHFVWGTYSGSPGAQIQLTFNVTNYPGDAPTVYGPYAVTQATEYLSVRFRGRLMSITVASGDLGSFWRIGSIKYRFAPAGRR